MSNEFNAKIILKNIRERREKKRKRRSKLDKYKDEIMALVNEGARVSEIDLYLREYKRMKVSTSAITRYIERLKDESKSVKCNENLGA